MAPPTLLEWQGATKDRFQILGAAVMEKRISTIFIEPRLVLRDALELLMGTHSYRVVCGVGSIDEMRSSVISDPPELVILGAQSAYSA